MSLTKRNVVVIGDLYVDHDIFVSQLETQKDSGATEPRYTVLRRQDTAGGAANSARILSVLSDGDTYLWGVVGNTHWGTFRDVLEKSHSIDAAMRNIELRGVGDESGPRMNTVTRLLVLNEDNPRTVVTRVCRYYDVNQVHVLDSKLDALLYHLERIHKKSPLHAIVINDFGRGTLTKDLIEKVAARASNYGVPLFIDPMLVTSPSDRTRYAGIRATAILPNLPEWCALVESSQSADYWRSNLNNPDALREMAGLSFQKLGNFEYHIIKCDRQGSVLFLPHPDEAKRHQYALYHLSPAKSAKDVVSPQPLQIGNGDVMTAVFAFEYPKTSPTTEGVLRAIASANAAVGSYREMPWHQMPSRRDVAEKQALSTAADLRPQAEISKSALFLPGQTSNAMADCETKIRGFFSKDKTFLGIISEFLKDVSEGWHADPLKSIVLGAPPGTGKTTVMHAVKDGGPGWGFTCLDLSSTEPGGGLAAIAPDKYREFFDAEVAKARPLRLLMFVDEALRPPAHDIIYRNAPTLLNAAHAAGARFLFLSAGFVPEMEQPQRTDWREFFRRTRTHYLSNLESRPIDIPYIVPARLFEKRKSAIRAIIDGDLLLAITDLALIKPEPSTVCDVVDEMLKAIPADATTIEATMNSLPDYYRKQLPSRPPGAFSRYEFRR
jgi:bifunctional ADP-heptose synthase (sugar kinase/adenylyltransferase)